MPARRIAAICAALLVITWIAFWGVRSNGFVNFDDDSYVKDNVHVEQGLSAASIAWAFASTECANWHPLTWLSHMLDVELFGLDAGKHHVMSLLLHSANVVLLFLVLFRMTGAVWRPALVAGLFAIHPLHVESVAWVAERKDVLSTLFWMLTLAAWIRYLESRSLGRYLLVVALYACGLMSKPMLVTFPFTLLLLDYWPLRRTGTSGLWREKAPLFAMSAASCVVTVVAQRAGRAVLTLDAIDLPDRLANALVAYAAYLVKTAWPTRLAFYYPLPPSGLPAWRIASAVLVITCVTGLAWRLAKRAPYFAVGWLWYLGTLVPVIGVVQVGGQAMADRYTYVPLIGIFVALAWGLGDAAASAPALRPAIACAATGAFVALVLATRGQVALWKDNTTLFAHAIEVTSDNAIARNNLGLTLFDQGKAADAIVQYEAALKIAPRYKKALGNLALALTVVGDDRGAVLRYAEALDIDPDDAVLHFQMARALARTGRSDEAVSHYASALRLNPAYAEAHDNLANLLAEQGRTDDAIAHYTEALRLKPDDSAAHYNFGNTLLAADRPAEAEAQLVESIRLNPSFAEAHNSLGVLYMREGRMPQAVAELTEALRLRPDLEGARRNLEAARAPR